LLQTPDSVYGALEAVMRRVRPEGDESHLVPCPRCNTANGLNALRCWSCQTCLPPPVGDQVFFSTAVEASASSSVKPSRSAEPRPGNPAPAHRPLPDAIPAARRDGCAPPARPDAGLLLEPTATRDAAQRRPRALFAAVAVLAATLTFIGYPLYLEPARIGISAADLRHAPAMLRSPGLAAEALPPPPKAGVAKPVADRDASAPRRAPAKGAERRVAGATAEAIERRSPPGSMTRQ
jgi:hypothetical protein